MSNITRRKMLQTAAGVAAVAPAAVLQLANANAATTKKSRSDEVMDISKLPRVTQSLVAPPFVPEHTQIAEGGPRVIEIELVVHEGKEIIDAIGTEAHILSFNGSVPGPLVICHEGDYVEMTLKNPAENVFAHNIDFHASTGALGGGALTNVQPGEQVVLRWKAVKSGTFVYHCAPGGSMIPLHVVSGMNGAVMVLPRDGLKDGSGNLLTYDRAYYIGEQDFYIPRDETGAFKKYASAAESIADTLATMRTLTPTHVVFNGKVGALTGDSALTAAVGETVLFIHSQSNRDSRPHLIGGHGDYVWEQGSFADAPATGLETWFIRGGSAGAAL